MARKIADEALLADLRRVAGKLGKRTLSRVEYDMRGRYDSRTITRRFGSWPKALRVAGLKLGLPGIPVIDLIADLKRVARKLGKRTVTVEAYRAYGRHDARTIARHFGCWANAHRIAGLRPTPWRCDIPDAALLADLRRIARKLGKRTITKAEYNARGGKYAAATISRRFHGWSRAILAADLQPSVEQIIKSRIGLRSSLRAIAAIPGLANEDRVEVAKTVDGVKDLGNEVIIQLFRRLNLGPMELPSGIPSGVPFWERCISALQRVQPDPEKLKATGVLERLGRQLHRAVAIEVLGREPLSPVEERRVAAELRRRKAA